MAELKDKIKKEFPEIVFDWELKKCSTMGVGGPADYLYRLTNQKELPKIISFAKKNKIPFYIVGGGSNILFDDKGFRGLIIRNELKEIEIKGEEITAQSGVTINELLRKSMENDISGLEPWSGLPGTVGGAVRGNAGCNGLETRHILKKATLFVPKTGKIKKVSPKYFEFSYRHSVLKENDEILIDATFKLKKRTMPKEEQQKIFANITNSRREKQPPGLSCGSFFKNPSPDKSAGLLIEKAGLKGKIIGKAKISEKHGNFIINIGGASSKDVLKLAELIKKTVKAKFKITLKEEVQILGSSPLHK